MGRVGFVRLGIYMDASDQKQIKIQEFARQQLGFKDCTVLEVFQGYLVGGRVNKKPRCFWINKQNIEGFVEVFKILALESTFSALLSFIPGGSFAYRLIRDQIGYPPRYNIIFEPDFYEIIYHTLVFDSKGQPQGVVDGLVHGIDKISKIALQTGSKIQATLKTLFSGGKRTENIDVNHARKETSERFGVLLLSFVDKTSLVRNRIIDERLQSTKSQATKLAKSASAGLIPAVVASFKTTEIDEATVFLNSLKKLGFSIKFGKTVREDV